MGCRDQAAGTNWVSTKHMNKDKFRKAIDVCPILLSEWLQPGLGEEIADEWEEGEEDEDEGWLVEEEEGMRKRRGRKHGRFQCDACGACRYVLSWYWALCAKHF